MAKKNDERLLFCIGENVVVIEGENITQIKIDEEKLKCQITKLLNEQFYERPIIIFKKAMETITGIKFYNKNYGYFKDKTIHESVFYRKYCEFIMNSEIYERKRNRRTFERKAFEKEERLAKTYGRIRRIGSEKGIKRRNVPR